ncbi:pentatricopeptide repeat (PPR) superfamily protein [Actinidia rufa]|uniref:Pentatricopeptide repeat (PPR) superfamily protein n=1 Tax=Actinidia rufa TaxID=165716 RepID=A0A7J0FY26_9ERIC|nr:pentatricopeptide repeat (PPR) superfamily protein [Actinidia rufa]
MFNSVKKEEGFTHNLLSYKCIIEKLGFHGEFEAMDQVLAEMRMNVDNSLLEGVYIGAMRNYGRKRKVQEAVDVFERMDFYNCEPSVQSYNAIMNILVEYGYFNQAHKVYMRMRDKKIVPDVYTFTIRMKSFCRTSRPHAALRLLKSMPSHGCERNAVAYCTVVGGFYDESFQFEAYELFDEMLRSGICPDITTFNKLMHTLSKKGGVQEGERLLNKILKRGVSPNLFTFNIFIQGLCRKGLLKEASSMVDGVRREGLSPDVVTYNTLICGLSKSFRVSEAESYLQKMVNEGFEPNAFTYNSIIDGYCKLGMVQNADKILNEAVFKGFVADEFTYCSLIYGLCQDGDVDRAMGVFNEALKKGLKPNTIMYNTQKGCIPDIWTYNLVINGLCKMGCVFDAHNLMSDAMAKGLLPDIFTFNTLIDGFCKHLMVEKGCVPDIITYNILMESLCKARKLVEALSLLEEIENKGLTPDNTDNVDSAYNFLHDNVEKGFIPSLATFGRVINCLSLKHRVHEAVGIVHLMVRKGIVPDIVNTIFEADKKEVAGPKIVVEDLLKKSHITYYAYELLYDGIRDKKLLKKKASKKLFS